MHINKYMHKERKMKSLSHVWLFATLMDCSLPGYLVHGIFQARVLEWVAISISRGSSWLRDQTRVFCIANRGLYKYEKKKKYIYIYICTCTQLYIYTYTCIHTCVFIKRVDNSYKTSHWKSQLFTFLSFNHVWAVRGFVRWNSQKSFSRRVWLLIIFLWKITLGRKDCPEDNEVP